MSHDPIDSLIYLNRNGLIDYVSEQLGFLQEMDEPADLEDLIDALDTYRKEVRKEMHLHYDGRRKFSTGHPFERVERYPSTEPGEDGEEVPVISESHVQLYPDGSPHEPLNRGAIWVTK